MKQKLVIVTTVPETLSTILVGQPRWLDQHFDVSCVTSPEGVDSVKKNESVPVYCVPMKRGMSPFNDLISIYKMYRLLRRLKPQIVHSYTPKAGLIAMSAAFFARIPLRVHTFTGLLFPTAEGFKKNILISSDRWVAFSATHIVPEGKGVMTDLLSAGISNNLVEVIGAGNIAGVDIKHFDPELFDNSSADRRKKFTFCYIGRLHSEKGVNELVTAFLGLQVQANLIILGAMDSTQPIDESTYNIIKTHPDINFLGFRDDIRETLHKIDVLVLPSFREGFPNVVLQAGAMGKPVIATDINGCNEIIEDGWNGWLVPPRDPLSLRQKMENAATLSSEDISVLGINARIRVRDLFSRDQYLSRLLDFYKSIISDRLPLA
jgi:glycosyltransferase involved in cell wall biosynthesis